MHRLRRTLITTAIFTLSAAEASAQLTPDWAVQRDFESLGFGPHTVATDAQGAIYVTGNRRTGPFLNELKILTIKLAPDGTELWASQHPPAQPGVSETSEAITIDAAGNVIVIRSGAWDVIKYDPADGSETWFVHIDTGGFGGPHALTTDAAGNIYITGESILPGGSREDFFTVKLDGAGNPLWTARYSGPGAFLFAIDVAVDIALDSNGDVFVTGPSPALGTASPNFVTIKYRASDGAQLWLARLDIPGLVSVALLISPEDDVYVTGSAGNVSKANTTPFVTVKYNGNDGSQMWLSVNLQAFIFGHAFGMALDSQGDVYVTGCLDPDGNFGNFNDNVVTMRLAADTGALRWLSIFGENPGLDEGRAIAIDAQDNVYVTGQTGSLGAANDLLLLLYDAATGQIVDQGTFGVVGPEERSIGLSLALDSAQNVIVAGVNLSGPGAAASILILKYPGPAAIAGDINADGVVDMNDVPVLAAVLVGTDTDPNHVAASDLNGDGTADGLDVQPFMTALIP